jgi:uncharacterized membrane protein
MNRLTLLLAPRWFGVALIALAVALVLAMLLTRRRRAALAPTLVPLAVAFGLVGVGGIALAGEVGFWVAVAGLAALFALLLWLLLTSNWSRWAALGAVALTALGLGGWLTEPIGTGLGQLAGSLRQMEVVQPVWLLLLLLVPLIIFLSYRSLAGLGPFRRFAAISLRCAAVIVLALALADIRFRQADNNVTVLFMVDRSLSIPPEFDPNAVVDPAKAPPDLRWERIKRFINESVEKRGEAHRRDRAGLIVFGRRPRLELPASDAPRFNFVEAASTIDANYTDIAAALKLGLASFPEGSGKRIVLISDGNENLGNAEEQARIAKLNGVQIDVVPLAAGQKNENEVLVQAIEAPPVTERGTKFPIRVLLRSFNPNPVVGTLQLKQIARDGTRRAVSDEKQELVRWVGPDEFDEKRDQDIQVTLRPGLNSIPIPPPGALPEGSYTYEATFKPIGVRIGDQIKAGLAGDRPQNNRATTHVLAFGQRRVLFVQSKPEHDFLIDKLKGVGAESKFRVDVVTSAQVPRDKADLGVFLSNYDCVILANVPSEDLTEEQQEMLRSNTFDQGCGLVMIGGPDSFGAGGWQATPVEKALPVDCDIKNLMVQGKGGLVLFMHGCEIPDGNRWEKEIAKLATKKLAPADMIGVQGLGLNGTEWHVKFQTVGDNRGGILRDIDKMQPGDLPEFDTGLNMAYKQLSDPQHNLAKRHMIIISDGDPGQMDRNILPKMKAAKITVSTVGVATHGLAMDQSLSAIANATGGKFYKVASAKALPEIYTKEVRQVSQSWIDQRKFTPTLQEQAGGPATQLPKELPPLYAFLRTTPKESARGVGLPILGPPQGDQQFPVLAYWQYGLGRSVAFTSDARSAPGGALGWDRDWAGSPMYRTFWEGVVNWSLRAVETGRLTMTTEYRDGKVRVTIDARDDKNQPLTDLNLRGGVTLPNPKADGGRVDLKFEQKNAGLYEAEFKAEEAGSYFLNAQSKRKVKRIRDGKEVEEEEIDSVRAGVTIPYSPEFADLETNTALLENLRALTGGKTYADEDDALKQAAKTADVFRPAPALSRSPHPFWHWLVLLACVLLFFDVAVRRIAVEPAEVAERFGKLWQRLRGTVTPTAAPQFLDRLRSRKAAVSEAIERDVASRRFDVEGGGTAPPPPPPPDAGPSGPAPTPARPTGPAPRVGPEAQQQPEDYASRLMRAKKRALGSDKEQGSEGS